MQKSKLSIAGVFINLESESFEGVKSAEQIAKLEIFNHLSASLKAKAEAVLAKKIAEHLEAKSEEAENEEVVIEETKAPSKVMTPANIVTEPPVVKPPAVKPSVSKP